MPAFGIELVLLIVLRLMLLLLQFAVANHILASWLRACRLVHSLRLLLRRTVGHIRLRHCVVLIAPGLLHGLKFCFGSGSL